MGKLAFDIFDKINIFKMDIYNTAVFIINSFYENFILCSQNILHASEHRNQ